MRRALKLLSVFVTLTPVWLVLAWLVWTFAATRAMEAGHQRLLDADFGFDVVTAQQRLGDIPDDRNAAPIIDKAVQSLVLETAAMRETYCSDLHLVSLQDELSQTPQEQTEMLRVAEIATYIDAGLTSEQAIVAVAEHGFATTVYPSSWQAAVVAVDDNSAALQELFPLEQLAEGHRVEARRPHPYRNLISVMEMIDAQLPHLEAVGELNRLVWMSAALKWHDGDHADALATIRLIEFHAQALGSSTHVWLDGVYALSSHTVAAERVAELLPWVDLSDASVCAEAEIWLAMLLDDDPINVALTNAIAGSTAVAQTKLRHDDATAFGVVGRPAHRQSAADLADYAIELKQALDQAGTMAETEAKLPPEPESWYGTIAYIMANPVYGRHAAEMRFRSERTRLLAATVIATSLYRNEHGDWPESLSDCVPDYLPVEAINPMTGTPIRYSSGDEVDPRPRVWTVGPDGEDDGGRAPVDDRDSDADNVRYLDSGPPPPRTWWVATHRDSAGVTIAPWSSRSRPTSATHGRSISRSRRAHR
ncbi:MAG: hypothetical protein AAGD32_00300 [Planctomycetota bacterium]